MLQTVRGMTKFWLKKKIAGAWYMYLAVVQSMTHDIADYLKTVNNVPEGYDVGKLCTEDPISVSRQFSLKFHTFFNKIIISGSLNTRMTVLLTTMCSYQSLGKHLSACA